MMDYLPHIAIGVSILSPLFIIFGFILRSTERITKLETKMDLFWSILSKKLTDVLISPHTPRLDELLIKFKDNSLSFDEIVEIKKEIEIEDGNTNCTDGKKVARAVILARIEQLLYENKKGKKWLNFFSR